MKIRRSLLAFLAVLMFALPLSGCFVHTHDRQPRRDRVVRVRDSGQHHDRGRHRGHERRRSNRTHQHR